MFSLRDDKPFRHCQGWSRRDFLRIGSFGLGAAGLGGLTLSQLLAAKAAASVAGRPVTDRSVVLLFLQGGPPQIETFDPKMSAPAEIRSITGEVQTVHSGITFGGTFPKLAKLADKFSIVRSYASKNAGHSYQEVASGGNALKATMGAVYARVAGGNHPTTGMPSNVLLLPEAVQDELKLPGNFETSALPTLTAVGELGPSCAAFNPAGGGPVKDNMELKITAGRLQDRRHLLGRLDAARRKFDEQADGLDRYKQQAFDVILGGIADAFDLSKESSVTLDRYDTSHLFPGEEVRRWFDMSRATNLLGRQMLLARRLCEAGAGFVTVSDCGWDFHSNNNSPKHLGGMLWLGPQVDHAVSAFIEDVEARGLSDKILLIVTGEMGRTPRINSGGGRDHWANLTPLLIYGGGLKMGQVVGHSDRQAGEPATKEFTPKNLLATVLHSLFDIGTLRVARGVPREIIAMVEDGEPIEHLG